MLTSIHPTIWFEPSKTIKKLIDKGLDFNVKTAEGTSFLYIAVRGNRSNSRVDSVCGNVRSALGIGRNYSDLHTERGSRSIGSEVLNSL